MVLGLILTLAQAAAPAATTEGFKFDYFRVKDRIEADGRARRAVEVSVLLRTPAAVQQFGQVGIPYVDGYGDVSFEQLRVQKASGAVIDVRDAPIEDLNPFGINAGGIPVDIRIKKLTIPQLEPGDRLSYTLITTLRPFVPGEAYGEMKFTPVPVDGPQVYELDMPAISRLTVNVRADLGASWEQLPAEKDRSLRRLTVTIPPTVVASTGLTEAQMDSFQTPDVAYTTFDSWAEVGEWWWEMSRSQVRADAAIKQEALRVIAGKTTPQAKVEAIASFVGSSVRYLNVGFGIGRMQPRAAASVLSSRYGDCKDKVGLVIAMADAVGIEVRPVLIHSARRDLQDETPGPHQFDHVIAAAILGPAEKDWVWLDATNSLSSPMTLFPQTRDKRALAIDREGQGTLVRTPASPPAPTHRLVTLTGDLDPSGVLRGHLRLDDRSDSEPNLRLSFASVPPEQHPELLKSVLGWPWKDARISSVRAADPVDIAAPFWVELDFERDVTGIDSQKEWKLWVPDLGPILVEAPADATIRKPIRFDTVEMTFKASVRLPESVTARAPLSVSMSRPFASLVSNYSVVGRTLLVERTFRFPQPSLSRDQLPAYEALRKAASSDRDQDFVVGPISMSAPGAASLQKEGKAAYVRKEYAKATELLQKAVAVNPELPGVHYDLGLALRESKKYDEAVVEQTKAIEADPFDDGAYAERAYALLQLDRDDEAEKDLVKQIELAPFKAWSYNRLAERRSDQDRHAEAAELYTKSLTIDATDLDIWVDLGWAQASAKRSAEARAAFDKAVQLGLKPGRRVYVALGYSRIGDTKTAGGLAEKDLAEVREVVQKMTAKNLSNDFLYWNHRLGQAWLLIGEAALEEQDLPKAERFLTAAWEVGLLPQAGYSLGRLREREGKLGVAAELWAAAATIGSWDGKPPDFARRLDALRAKGHDEDGSQETTRLRFMRVPGTAATSFTEDILVLYSEGRVEAVKNLSKKREVETSTVADRLIGQKASLPTPDGGQDRFMRKALLICDTRSGCTVAAHIPGARGPIGDVGTISIVSMSPADMSTITAGEIVHLTISVAYELTGVDAGDITLVVNGQNPARLLLSPQPTRVVLPGKGVVDFDVTFVAPKDEKTVHLSLPLSVGHGSTRTVASARFSIKP